MALNSISVRGFRNLEPVAVEFSPTANYVFGPNAAGKTNLLEAIHYLAIGRSFRRCPDAELLGFGQEVLVVSGRDDSGRCGEIRFDGREKRLASDGHDRERLSEYFGWLPVVVLLLDDIELVRGGPSLRRGFLDMAIAKVDRDYIRVLGAYRRVLSHCNRLLESAADSDQLPVWEEELVRTGVPVCDKRREVTDRLLAAAAGYFRRLAHGSAEFGYWSSIGDGEGLAGQFHERLASTRRRAVQLRHTLVGPHRDDLRIRRGDRDLRRFGSVGEQRLAGIALRLAEADLLLGSGGRPVFLLDEIASELDEERAGLVFRLIAERGQMIYAAARRISGAWAADARSTAARDAPASLESLNPRSLDPCSSKEFHVESGRITPA